MGTSDVSDLDNPAFQLVCDLNGSGPTGGFDFPDECHAFNFSLSLPPVSVLKIPFLLANYQKFGPSEKLRNYYGLRGDFVADELTPPADDFLAKLTIQWEDAIKSVEGLGVRRVVLRQAVVLAPQGGIFPLMALPVRLFAGGPIGSGKQAVPWIHMADVISAIRFLMENQNASGAYNLISPAPTSNAEFVRAVAKALHHPYWLPMPSLMLRVMLGEMSVLVTEGRYCKPKRLLELGYQFRFPGIEDALADLFH